MDFYVNDSYLVADQASCLVIGLFDDGEFTQQGQELDQLSGGYLTQLKQQENFSGEFNQSLLLHRVPQLNAGRVLLLGCGKKEKFTPKKYQQVVQTMVKSLNQGGTTEIICLLPQLEMNSSCFYWRVRIAVEAIIDATYQFTLIKSQKKLATQSIKKVAFYVTAEQSKEKVAKVIAKGKAIAKGVQVAKDLGNLPPNICNPAYLAERAEQLAATHTTSVSTTIINEAKMRELGMNAYLAVGQGSANESMMSIMEYRSPNSVNSQPIVLVGKGLTFDAGGISLKPGEGMDEMKYDMCGAASVYGLMQAVAELQLPLHVIGVLAGCENMPDAEAYRPGDIITTMSGKTIEILNTDAEGRMVLCDVLSYVERYQPELVIDVATLTGACVVALGHHLTGLMSNNQELANQLIKAADLALDGVWQLPLGGEYQAQLDSNFADMANIGGRTGGAITAGTFLSNFTEKYTWAHLDIAGTAWVSGKNKGSTGRPVALLTQFLINYAKGDQQGCKRTSH